MDGKKDKNNITHGAIVPLAGGFALGASNILNKPPTVIFSYKAFEANDKLYLNYLKQHNISVPYYQIDNTPNIHDITSKLRGTIDIFHGILPCSGLSQAAQRKAGSRGTAAPNDWMYESARFLLGTVKPIVYSFENAPALFTSAGGPVRDRLVNIGKEFGYATTFYKTNTIKHGVPQFRPRTFGLFVKGDKAPILEYYDRPMTKLDEYLKQIPKDATYQDKYMTCDDNVNEYEITKYFKKIYGNDWRNKIYETYKTHLTSYDYLKRQGLVEDFRKFLDTLPNATDTVKKNTDHVIKKTAMGKGFRLGYRVLGLDRDYVYAVISEMMNRTLHPTEDRLINIREHMHLMGLPFDYELNGTKEYPKITQNVPVKTCEDITTEIVEIINGNRRFSNTSILMQDNTKQNNKSKILF